MTNCQLLIDYVYLDSEERKRFAQASHEYLIEQLQFTGSESLTSVSNKYRLNFNHPSKYLIWVPHLDRYLSRNNWAVHALVDGSWEAAKEKMAKLTAQALCNARVVAGSVVVDVKHVGNPAADGLVLLDSAGNSLPKTAMITQLSPVSVLCKPYDASNVGVNTWTITIGKGTNAWEDALNNCVVIDNELTWADMSYTVEQLSGGVVVPVLAGNGSVSIVDQFNYGNFVNGSDNPVIQAKIQLNGHDRFQVLDGYYFNYVQPYQHFSNTPSDGVNVYSFALKAEDHQPTGSCNFSRIDNATLQVDLGVANNWASASALGDNSSQSSNAIYVNNFLGANSSLLNIYTVNYNVLRVMSREIRLAYRKKLTALKSNTLIRTTHKNKQTSLVVC